MALPVVEEGKLLSEALNTVKIQFQQMRKNLVCLFAIFTLAPELFVLNINS